jgi:hypothetical protein
MDRRQEGEPTGQVRDEFLDPGEEGLQRMLMLCFPPKFTAILSGQECDQDSFARLLDIELVWKVCKCKTRHIPSLSCGHRLPLTGTGQAQCLLCTSDLYYDLMEPSSI